MHWLSPLRLRPGARRTSTADVLHAPCLWVPSTGHTVYAPSPMCERVVTGGHEPFANPSQSIFMGPLAWMRAAWKLMDEAEGFPPLAGVSLVPADAAADAAAAAAAAVPLAPTDTQARGRTCMAVRQSSDRNGLRYDAKQDERVADDRHTCTTDMGACTAMRDRERQSETERD